MLSTLFKRQRLYPLFKMKSTNDHCKRLHFQESLYNILYHEDAFVLPSLV